MLSGRKREVTNIDPKVNIYHKCNYNGVSNLTSCAEENEQHSRFVSVLLPKTQHQHPVQLHHRWQLAKEHIQHRNDQPEQQVQRRIYRLYKLTDCTRSEANN